MRDPIAAVARPRGNCPAGQKDGGPARAETRALRRISANQDANISIFSPRKSVKIRNLAGIAAIATERGSHNVAAGLWYAVIRAGRSPAIRRLRAAFSLFGDRIDDRQLPILRAELKAVANALGPARDLHVLVSEVGVGGDLLSHLDALRAKEVRAAQAMLSTCEFQRLLFDIALWVEGGDWIAESGDAGGEQELSHFATSVLSRRRRKLKSASADSIIARLRAAK